MNSAPKAFNKKITTGIGIGIAIIAIIIAIEHIQETQEKINQHNAKYLSWQNQVNNFKTEYVQAYTEDVGWYKNNMDYNQELNQYALLINSGQPRDQDEENVLNNEKSQLNIDYNRLVNQDLKVSADYNNLVQEGTELNQEAQQLNQQMANDMDEFKDKINNLEDVLKNGG